MDPIDIKYALERAGYSQADVARRVRPDLNRTAVNAVIQSKGRSRAIEIEISRLIEKPLSEIWPHWYGTQPKPRRRRVTIAEAFAKAAAYEAERQTAKAA